MKNKKVDNNLFFLIIGIVIFCIMLLLFSVLIITKTIDAIKLRNGVSIITSIVIVIIGLLLFTIMNKNRKYIVVLYILSGVIFIIILGLIFANLIGADSIYNYQGNNIYNSQYVKSIGSKGYHSIDEGVTNVIKEKYGEDDYEELYRVFDENYIWVFEKSDLKIIELEFYEEDSKYFYSGSTVLTYDSTISTSEYSDIETIRADVAHSIFFGMKEENIIYPVWGVSEYSEIENVSINNVKIDYAEKLMDSNEREYYFWIITNIGKIENAEDIEKITISGI